MKTLTFFKFIAVAGSIVVATDASFAQTGAAGARPGVDPSLMHLFGKKTSFTAKCDVRTLDTNQVEKASTPMEFALLDSKMRVDVNLALMKSKDMPPNAAAMLKQMGMDHVVSISRPDKKIQYIVYPSAESCVNLPLSEEDTALLNSTPKIEKSALGKETLDGHSCVKNKVVLTYDIGVTNEFTTWNATDLKDFPVQIQSTDDDEITMMRFSEVSLSKPGSDKFEVPSDYKQYDSIPAFTQAMMQRMLQQATPPK